MKRGSPGTSALASVLGNMAEAKSNKPLSLDFGVIQADYSLKTNTFGIAIPRGEYSVCRCVTYDPGVPLTQTYCDGGHSQPDAGYGGEHINQVELPVKMYWIRPGDRVLVAWVDNEAVVIDLVYRSDIVG